ncbi:hypothetical protein Agub_g7241 [Astrephomene gubernaculifera]|uniref:Gag1-like clamp domain-containing protein n=1 Tax=Astrephomene gubernaculifera TaxID=47775 RepID=A0AAD3HM43_9CHLO|nr:hypothetical protein Agub_g7241 [Astrephomene gubernaculifera]
MASSLSNGHHKQHERRGQEGEQDPGPPKPNGEEMEVEWVNEGYVKWLAQREKWTSGTRPAQARQRNVPTYLHTMVLGEKPFPRAVPLEAVVECLVEMWEEEDDWD